MRAQCSSGAKNDSPTHERLVVSCLTFSLRMRAVWRHDVFMTRAIRQKNGMDTLCTLHTSTGSGDAVLTNEDVVGGTDGRGLGRACRPCKPRICPLFIIRSEQARPRSHGCDGRARPKPLARCGLDHTRDGHGVRQVSHVHVLVRHTLPDKLLSISGHDLVVSCVARVCARVRAGAAPTVHSSCRPYDPPRTPTQPDLTLRRSS